MTPDQAVSLRPSDKDAIVSTPFGDGKEVLATVNKYPGAGRREWNGALIEETSAFRLDVEQFYDIHTLVWDESTGETLDVRNDAVESDVSYESSRIPEIHISNEFRFADQATATLSQDVIVSVDVSALVVQNRIAFSKPADRTLFTVLGLGMYDAETDDDVSEAYYLHTHGYDFVVAHDGTRYLAFAQYCPKTNQTTFDGHRIGLQGREAGDDKSAWHDIYEENDGTISRNDGLQGKVDAGVGLVADGDVDVTWLTAVGFGESEHAAIENVLDVLRNRYSTERALFSAVWQAWHSSLSGSPVDDAGATERYELSLTSMKCAQDNRGAIIAGAFKPQEFAYRFVWPRDLVVMIQALLSAGGRAEARRALDWLAHAQITDSVVDSRGIDRRGTWWQNYFVDWTPHWTALQLDQVGGPIYAHWTVWRETGDDSLLEAYYDTSKLAAEFLLGWDNGDGFPRKHQDSWEEVWGHTTEGSAAAIAGLRSMAELADAAGDADFATRCRTRANEWTASFNSYCFKQNGLLGDHYVTADAPCWGNEPRPDRRPDAAAFMAYWPWNVVSADSAEMLSTVGYADHDEWCADQTPCVGRYPGDDYTPSGVVEDGGWPLCEAYADVVRWQSGVDENAVSDYIFDHSGTWVTAAGLLPERVDGGGNVRWNSNLSWSQAMYVLLVESHARGEPFGFAPGQ